MSASSNDLLYVFGVLLVALIMISSFGGGLRYEEPFLGVVPPPSALPGSSPVMEKYGSPEAMIAQAQKREMFAEDGRDSLSYAQGQPPKPVIPAKPKDETEAAHDELEGFYAAAAPAPAAIPARKESQPQPQQQPQHSIEAFDGCMYAGCGM